MEKVIKDWVHIPGIHCGSVALRDVMNYHGYEWSEAMCFGIGAGLGFYYNVEESISPTRMIFVRGPDMEPNFFSLIDKPTHWQNEDDDEKAHQELKDRIDKHIPVLIQTDIYYLDYYNSSTHFPGHVVSVWGYDDEREIAYVADTQFEGLKSVPYDKFKSGRTSKDSSNPLRNNWIPVDPEKPLRPLSEIIPEAIRKNAEMMIEGTAGGRGESSVRMIKRWSQDLPNWKDAPDWSWCARFGYQVIKKRGVGGAAFRWMYRDFLKEAEDIVPSLKQFKLSQKMGLIGDRWSEMSDILKEISEQDEPDSALFAFASERAGELWGLERDFYTTVLENL